MLVNAPKKSKEIKDVELFGNTIKEPLLKVTRMRAGFYQYVTKQNGVMQVSSIDIVNTFMKESGFHYYVVDQKVGTDSSNHKIQEDDGRILLVNTEGLEELIKKAEEECV